VTAPNARGFFVGDYEGLGTAGRTFYPFCVAKYFQEPSNQTDDVTTTISPNVSAWPAGPRHPQGKPDTATVHSPPRRPAHDDERRTGNGRSQPQLARC